MQPTGKIPLDFAPKDGDKHEKWGYVKKGQLLSIIGTQQDILKAGDTISFDCTKPHYFKNISKKNCEFMLVENPGRY